MKEWKAKKQKKNFYTFLPALFIVGVSFLRISSVPTEQWTKDKVEKKWNIFVIHKVLKLQTFVTDSLFFRKQRQNSIECSTDEQQRRNKNCLGKPR